MTNAITKEQHTPGPWSIRERPNGTLGIDAKEPDGSYCQPAQINGDATDKVYGPVTRANAQLIAAAPDLLAALQQAMLLLESANAKCTQDTAFIQNCRAAIAKAEGGA